MQKQKSYDYPVEIEHANQIICTRDMGETKTTINLTTTSNIGEKYTYLHSIYPLVFVPYLSKNDKIYTYLCWAHWETQ